MSIINTLIPSLNRTPARRQAKSGAVDIALAATRQILSQRLDEAAQGRLIDEAIRELPGKLN